MNTETRRAGLWSLLGDLPTVIAPSGRKTGERRIANATVEEWILQLNGVEDVPAVVVVPDERATEAPAIIYTHTHSGDYAVGKSELFTGIPGVMRPYVDDLVALGVVMLAIDSWCFEERQRNADGKLGEQETFSRMLWDGQVLFGMMVFDLHQALTWLGERPDVDAHNIGVLGMSMGATQGWWLAALDERVKLCVDICCLTDYDALIEADSIGLHGVYYFVPSLRKHFTSAQINALIAPRARLSLNGINDPWSPSNGVERIAAELRQVYEAAGVPHKLDVQSFDCAHEELPQMHALALERIKRELVES